MTDGEVRGGRVTDGGVPHGRVRRVLAPAKLTVSLRVTGVRADGYHELDAEMRTLSLADELLLDEGGSGLAVEVEPGVRPDGLPAPGENLVERALGACGRRAAVHLTKRIPLGGGLGGGSADAAAVLRWAGCSDPDVAVRLGADVPFCVVGGRARVEGVGEKVTPLPFEAREYLLLLPPFGVETARVYRAWDEDPRQDGTECTRRRGAGGRAPAGPLARRAGGLGRERARAGRERLDVVRRGWGGGREGGAGGVAHRGRNGPAGARPHGAGGLGRGLREERERGGGSYLPARRCHRVAFSIFLCFFLRIRLRRFLISDPMSCGRLAVLGVDCQVGPRVRRQPWASRSSGSTTCNWPCRRAGRPRRRPSTRGFSGWSACPSPSPRRRAVAAGSATGRWQLHLGVEEDFRPARKAHPALVVRDLPALEAVLRGAGVEVRPNPDAPPGAGAYVDDPFGNRIELIAGTERELRRRSPERRGGAGRDGGGPSPPATPAAGEGLHAIGGRWDLRRRGYSPPTLRPGPWRHIGAA